MSGTSTYSQLLGFASDLLSGISQGVESENQDEYTQRVDAYKRELERIQNENEQRRNRVSSRNEIINQMGGGYESRAPKQMIEPAAPSSYKNDSMADSMDMWSGIIGGIGDMFGGSSSDSGLDLNMDNSDAVARSEAYTPQQVDTNTVAPTTDTQYAYRTRYENPNRYLT